MTYIALLRGINVGGTGQARHGDLIALCTASASQASAPTSRAATSSSSRRRRKPRSRPRWSRPCTPTWANRSTFWSAPPTQLTRSPRRQPVPHAGAEQGPGRLSRTTTSVRSTHTALAGEQLAPGLRELYIYYPLGQGKSKLKLPPAKRSATARNLNTVAKLDSSPAILLAKRSRPLSHACKQTES